MQRGRGAERASFTRAPPDQQCRRDEQRPADVLPGHSAPSSPVTHARFLFQRLSRPVNLNAKQPRLSGEGVGGGPAPAPRVPGRSSGAEESPGTSPPDPPPSAADPEPLTRAQPSQVPDRPESVRVGGNLLERALGHVERAAGVLRAPLEQVGAIGGLLEEHGLGGSRGTHT